MATILSRRCGLVLPDWLPAFVAEWPRPLDSAVQCMTLTVALSAENVRQGTGGPFGAIVVDTEAGRLLSAGVNLVTELNLSLAHAEMVALSLAQASISDWNLGRRTAGRQAATALFSSCEPCAMCFGAIPWSGVTGLYYAARKSDAESAGFDEGDKPEDWPHSLVQRGITVNSDLLREEAAAVLQSYGHSAGEIYSP